MQNKTGKALDQIFEAMGEIQAFYKSCGLCDFDRTFEFFYAGLQTLTRDFLSPVLVPPAEIYKALRSFENYLSDR